MKVRKKQCKACPWKKSTNPNEDIPGNYTEELHKGLIDTIAEPSDLSTLGEACMRMMACHETTPDDEYPCVGWLVHQLGPGNNIALRIRGLDGCFSGLETVGEQHTCFEDTLP